MILPHDLQHAYFKLAQKIRKTYYQLPLGRVEALSRYGLLQLILVRLLRVSHHELGDILFSLAPNEPHLSSLLPLLADCDALLPRDYFSKESLTYLMSDVMGVYEQSLAYHLVEHGQELELQIDQSLRQREGAYYTPTVVVQFLVERTVGGAVQHIKAEAETFLAGGQYQAAQATIDTLKTVKVFDITCGSGIFLLAACDILTRAYCWWNERLQALAGGNASFLLAAGLREESFPAQTVLQHCIFGIDRDPLAVAIARLNLSLWVGAMNCVPTALQHHIVVTDALYPFFDIDVLLDEGPQRRIILGNPPWGADIASYKGCLSGFKLARGQYDSYELCIERATQCLHQGDMLGFVVPDSILQPPEHTPLREFLLRSYQLDTIVKLGEGVFENVFRGTVMFSATRKEQVATDHRVQCRIVVKQERNDILLVGCRQRDAPIQALLDTNGTYIMQGRFLRNKDKVFDLFTSDEDEQIVRRIEDHALHWRAVLSTGRGVEIAKTGAVLACPVCKSWQKLPHKQKKGSYAQSVCVNPLCNNPIDYELCRHATMIMSAPTEDCTQPIIVGENLNRYQVLATRYIDLTKGTYIRYKAPDLYIGEKLLVRKTGRGIYATIDKTGAYTNQVVFIFKLKQDRPVEQQRLRLSYILGVLNSRMMLYYYYKSLGDIEWKSFPYMTQNTIMGLPIRKISFSDPGQSYLHDKIADLVDSIVASGKPPDSSVESEIEQHVRMLYMVDNPEANARIDAELERIRGFGSLLGSREIDAIGNIV